LIVWLVLLAFVILIPFIVKQNKYIIHVCITIAFNICLATSMWLIWTLGLVSFAHAAFMGIGAYTSALLFLRLNIPLWAGMWIGAIIAAVFALIISFPLMRTKAVYFFMASWAVGEVVKRVFAYYRQFFGGWEGLFRIRPPKLLALDFSNRTTYYYLAMLFMVLIVLSVYRINRSRTGWVFWSIHDAELLSAHVGINPLRFKVFAFTLACFFVGLTGALYAHYHTYINPKSFDIWVSEFALVHIIVGGLSTVAGPILGATFLTIVDELLRPTEYFRVILFGVILILTVLFLPGGLESIPRRLRGKGGSSEDMQIRNRLLGIFKGLVKTKTKKEK
ncbi:MAG: branched-chain amino acid ABC transporter permease, partial [Spirochaetales bacterium]